jgi:regulator of sirC expression with transglutaminase-like and TPR domain
MGQPENKYDANRPSYSRPLQVAWLKVVLRRRHGIPSFLFAALVFAAKI